MRSGTAGALVASLLLIAIFITNQAWRTSFLVYIYPFLNGYLPPQEVLASDWTRTVVSNLDVKRTFLKLFASGS